MMDYKLSWKLLLLFLLIPVIGRASFIEATMGTAVVNDATATYFNPAALTLLKNAQIIALGTGAQFNSEFTGTVTQTNSGFSQTGSTPSHTNYFLPSGYFALPLSNRFYFGIAVVANNFNRDVDQNSILRYTLSDNNIQDIDFVPALGIKINNYLSLGAGLNFSQAEFNFTPISGTPALGVPDIQSKNDASAHAVGGDVGLLLQPFTSTLIGFNYRTAMTYHFNGTSQLESNPPVTANNFSFDYWTPARYVLSINQFLSRSFGMIGTVQWIKSDIYNKINANNTVTQIGPIPVILSDVTVPLYFNNTWIYTVGSYYRLSPKWTFRIAGNYVQSPGNPNYQVTEGNNIILGTSVGYKLNKVISLDASYSHAFVQNQPIDIQNSRSTINGINAACRNSISLKIIANV